MAKINSLDFNALMDDDLNSLLNQIVDNIEKSKASSNAQSLVAAVNEYKDAHESVKDNELVAADTEADFAWRHLNAFLCGAIYHPALKDAAESVKLVFDATDDPTELPYEEEYRLLADLLSDLDAISADVKKNAMVDVLIEDLRVKCDKFNALYSQYKDTQKAKDFARNKQAERVLHKELNEMLDNVNANLRVNPTAELESFANSVQSIIDKPVARAVPRRR